MSSKCDLPDERQPFLTPARNNILEEVLNHYTETEPASLDSPSISECNNSRLHSKSKAQNDWRRGINAVKAANRFMDYKDGPGSAPGIDVSSVDLSSILPSGARVRVTDFSASHVASHSLNGEDLPSFLQNPRPDWAQVRWLNVSGMSWDVIRTIAHTYQLHPLAVEDIIHIPQRIKVDSYDNFLYISLLLVHTGTSGRLRPLVPSGGLSTMEPCNTAWSPARLHEMWASHHPDHKTIKRPVEVLAEQVNIFLLRDNTVISFFQADGELVTRPIMAQIANPGTLVRMAGDASFLVNLLLDAMVDHSLLVINHYARCVANYEIKVLDNRPSAGFTRELYVMQCDLNALRTALLPTTTLLHTLRAHRVTERLLTQSRPDLVAAGVNSVNGNGEQLISKMTHMYLSDVQDHIHTAMDSLEALSVRIKDLIDLIFSLINHQTNQAMQALAVVSSIFLPITFIAGVYGTNFEFLPEIHWKFGYGYFWGMCTLVTVIFILVLRQWGMVKFA